MILVASSILAVYILLLLLVARTWQEIKTSAQSKQGHQLGVSIIVVMRDEVRNLPGLIQDLNEQDYQGPLEVILVDDDSQDQSIQLATSLQGSLDLKVLSLPSVPDLQGSRKKKAITLGVARAKHALIMLTDADCRLAKSWVRVTADFQLQQNAQMVCGLVRWDHSAWWLQPLIDLEFAALQAFGAASIKIRKPNMCNGANLAFTKEAFDRVGGYQGYEHVISGDDEFLLHKIWSHYRGGVSFLKHAQTMVTTTPAVNGKEFWNQRRRWSGKWKYYRSWSTRTLAVFIVLVHISNLALWGYLIANAASGLMLLQWPLLLLILKTFAEALVVLPVLRFQQRRFLVGWFLAGQLLYSLYAILFGLLANFGSYNWKNRRYT